MVIKKIEITNFAGIRGTISFDMPQILALCGKNGMGKTTLMNAIRFGLTGEEPEGDIINSSSLNCSVKIWLPTTSGDLSFERLKEREKPSKFKINGKATTAKAMNEKIEDIVGIPIDRIKVLSSAEVVAAMKPQEFSSFILGYIPEKMTIEKVMSFLPTSTIGVMEIMEANLPIDGIDLDVLNEFDKFCRDSRKSLKTELAAKKLIADEKKSEKPEHDKETLEARLKELNNLENEYKMYLVKKAAYEREIENIKRIEAQVVAVKAEAEKITATRPDPGILDSLTKEKNEISVSLDNQRKTMYGIKSAVATLNSTLEAINNSVCPISPLIKCGTDKTEAKIEIEESIKASEDGIAAIEEEVKNLNEKMTEVERKITEYRENASLYEKKLSYNKQVKSLEDSKPTLSVAPVMVESVDVETERFQIQQKLKVLADYEDFIKITAQISDLEVEVADFETLVKAMSEKGAVRTGIVNAYLGVFEEICNDRSKAIRSEVNFKFVSENGVVVLMDTGSGDYLPYDSLSGGERAYMIYIIIDMLNQLVGTKLLLLDELSVIDEKCFNTLLDLVMRYAGDYDHIILSAVDHTDTVEAFKNHEIPFVSDLKEIGISSESEEDDYMGLPF